MKREISGATVAAMVLGAVLAGPASAGATVTKRKRVKLTAKTVVVSPATVRRNLTGISKDGKTFRFKHAAGRLGDLHKGSIMLLKGRDVAKVTKVKHRGGKLLVVTKPAKVTDVIKSGTIHFKGKPDVRKAFLATTTAPTGARATAAAASFAPPSYPYVGRPLNRLTATGESGPSISAQGSKGPFGYSLTFTPKSRTRIDISGVLCFQYGSVCSNGPSNGTSAEVNVDGYIDTGQQEVGVTVDGGSITDSSLAIKNLSGEAKINYTISRGQGDADKSPPIFRVPLGVDYSVPVGPYGVPMYFKLQTALLLKLGAPSKNAVIRGGADVTTKGASETIGTKGKHVTTKQTGGSSVLDVLTRANGTGLSESLAPTGAVVAVQFPKIGAGLGTRAFNGIGYIDLVTSMGQTVGSALAGQLCSSYDLVFTVGAGLEAQFGPFGVASPKKTLYERQQHVAEPGCGG
jgi:hypothetical protein